TQPSAGSRKRTDAAGRKRRLAGARDYGGGGSYALSRTAAVSRPMQKSLEVAVSDGREARVMACDVKTDGRTLDSTTK
ncbi:MAG: hypothetical protein NTX09_16520, partial [Verrucomicrobia bacterium]|nr:hypothetical protein [Verrucomicrobiota bacterium]